MPATSPHERSAVQSRWLGGRALWGALSLALTAMVVGIVAGLGWNEEGLAAAIRWTARTSFLLFILAFAASSVQRRWPNPAAAWALRNRRYLGLSFVSSHYLHMAAILSLAASHSEFRGSVDWVTILFGGVIGYGVITAMALTSNDTAVAKLGRSRWRRLHVAGSYYLWILFFQSYAGRAVMETTVHSVVATLVALAALGLRLAPAHWPARTRGAIA